MKFMFNAQILLQHFYNLALKHSDFSDVKICKNEKCWTVYYREFDDEFKVGIRVGLRKQSVYLMFLPLREFGLPSKMSISFLSVFCERLQIEIESYQISENKTMLQNTYLF